MSTSENVPLLHYAVRLLASILMVLVASGCAGTSKPVPEPSATVTRTAPVQAKAMRPKDLSARPSYPRGVVYEGPNNMAEWTGYDDFRKSWHYSNGKLKSTGNRWVGRNANLPDRCTIEFQMSWRDRLQGIFIGLYTCDPRPRVTFHPEYKASGYYTVEFFWDGFNLVRYQNNQDEFLHHFDSNYFFNHDTAKVKIFCDKKEKFFALMVDDLPVAQWHDDKDFAGEGTGISFQAWAENNEFVVSNIRVSKWVGDFAGGGVRDAP